MEAAQRFGQLLVFELGDEACALKLESVREVVPMARLAQPPGRPELLEGFLNLAGEAVPVIRLDRLFGLPESPPALSAHLVVLRGSGSSTALVVDRAAEIVSCPPPGAWAPIRKSSCFNDCAEAEIVIRDRTVHLLSPDRLLLEQERRRIAELQAEAQRRLAALEVPEA